MRPSGEAPGVLSAPTATLLLLSCLFGGFLAGGLRDPVAAAPFLAALWLIALLSPPPSSEALKPWLGFLAWICLSLLASQQPLTGLVVLGRWGALALFFSLAVTQWTETQRRRWFWCLAGCSLVLAVAAVSIHRPSYPYVGLLPLYYNYTCFVEAAFLCAAAAVLLRPDGPRGAPRWVVAAVAAAALAEICWAHSRGALVAVAAGAGVCLWRNPRGRNLLSVAAALAGLLAVGLIFTSLAKISVAKSFKRPQIWQAGLACTLDHPVLGAGPGQFANAFLRHNFPAGYGLVNYRARAEHAHSEVLETAAEFGWPGLILLLAALAASLRPQRPEESSWAQEAALAAWVGMSVQCLADNMLHLPSLGLLYASALAVARRPPADPAPVAGLSWRALAWAGFLLACLAWLPGRLSDTWQRQARHSEDPQRRLALLLRCTRLAPADPYLREDLARARLAQRPVQVEAALAQLAQAERMSPFDAVYSLWRGRLLAAGGSWPQALAAADRAVVLEPDFLEARSLRVEALTRLGQLRSACAESEETERRARVLAGQINTGSGYAGLILAFDRARFAEAARRAGCSGSGGRLRPRG